MKKVWKRSACPYDCPDACGLLMETDGQKVYRVKGDPEHPVTRGFICRKMQHYEKTIHHPDRILTPLKRRGRKGEGDFVPISWEEALCEISMRWKSLIADYGSACILPYSYAGVEHLIQNKCGEAFFNYLGASALERTICSKAKTAGLNQIIGSTQGLNLSELDNSDLIVIWGSNITATWLHALEKVVQARRRGVKVFLIETYKTPASRYADETITLVPGTDGALALSMAHVLKANHYLDKAFMTDYVAGWEPFIESLDPYTPSWASSITGAEAEVIIRLARAYGEAKAPAIIYGSGMSRHGNGAMTTRCITALPAITGAFARKGGGILANISTSPAFNPDSIRRPDFIKKARRSINMNQIGDALTSTDMDAPIKSLYVYNSNPADIAPSQKKVLEGLQREDLFTVVHERFMTDTALYADVILPADTSAEHGDIVTPYGNLAVQQINPVIAPLGECKSNWDTFCLLADAMGFEDDFFKQSAEALKAKMIHEPNAWRNEWRTEEAAAFNEGRAVLLKFPDPVHFCTPSGKIELYNEKLPEPLPVYIENFGGHYPLRLVVAPSLYTLNSTFNEREALVKERGTMRLLISPGDARRRGIQDGDKIDAFNDLAHVHFYAAVTDAVPSGTAVAEGVYTLRQSINGLTVNALLSQKLTDYGRAATLCDNTIDIAPLS